MPDQDQGETQTDTIRIYGDHFGDSPTSDHKIEYTKGSSSSPFLSKLTIDGDERSVFDWGDDLIKFHLPSYAASGSLRVSTPTDGWSNYKAYEVLYGTREYWGSYCFWTDTGAADIDYQFAYRLDADSTVSDVIKTGQDSSDAATAIDAAFQTWEDVEYSRIIFDDQGLSATLNPYSQDDVSTVYWSASGTGAAAVCHVIRHATADTIKEFDIEMNYWLSLSGGGYQNLYWTANGPDASYKDIQDVVTHEVGHGLGLDDMYGPVDSDKTMYFSSARADTFRRTLSNAEVVFAQWVHYYPSPKEAAANAVLPERAVVVEPNYPNPFNPQTAIRFRLAESGPVTVGLYSVSGQKVRSLRTSTPMEPGDHHILWDGTDDAGAPVSTGVYLCEVRYGDEAVTQKMTLIR